MCCSKQVGKLKHEKFLRKKISICATQAGETLRGDPAWRAIPYPEGAVRLTDTKPAPRDNCMRTGKLGASIPLWSLMTFHSECPEFGKMDSKKVGWGGILKGITLWVLGGSWKSAWLLLWGSWRKEVLQESCQPEGRFCALSSEGAKNWFPLKNLTSYELSFGSWRTSYLAHMSGFLLQRGKKKAIHLCQPLSLPPEVYRTQSALTVTPVTPDQQSSKGK